MSVSWSGPGRDRELREPAAERREPRTWVTVVCVPYFGDDGVQRLHAPVKQPEPEAEPSPYPLPVSERARPGPVAVPEPEAWL
jgi:hypothetical protein